LQTLIASGGSIASKIAIFLARKGDNVSVIDEDEKRSESLSKNSDATVYNGSVLDPEILMMAGIEKTDSIVTALEDDEKSIKFISFAKSQYGVPRIFAIAKNSDAEDGFIQAGATKVISSEVEILTDFENIYSSVEGHRTIYFDKSKNCKIVSATIRATSSALGKDVEKIRKKDCRIVALLRDGQLLFPEANEGETPLEMGDELFIIGIPEPVEKLVEVLNKV